MWTTYSYCSYMARIFSEKLLQLQVSIHWKSFMAGCLSRMHAGKLLQMAINHKNYKFPPSQLKCFGVCHMAGLKDKSPSLYDEYKQHNIVCYLLDSFVQLMFFPFTDVGGTEKVITTSVQPHAYIKYIHSYTLFTLYQHVLVYYACMHACTHTYA